jgi:hypothetical protein
MELSPPVFSPHQEHKMKSSARPFSYIPAISSGRQAADNASPVLHSLHPVPSDPPISDMSSENLTILVRVVFLLSSSNWRRGRMSSSSPSTSNFRGALASSCPLTSATFNSSIYQTPFAHRSNSKLRHNLPSRIEHVEAWIMNESGRTG